MPPPMTTAPARFPLSICGRRLRVTHAAPLNRLREQGRQVDDLELGACGAHAVVEHHGAEGACHRQGLRPGAHGFAHALLVDGPASTLLHPHARAARSAAERALAVARHLHSPAGRGGQLAWRLAHVVVAREVARVVVRDRPVAGERLQLAFPHEPGQELGVVHDLVPPPEIRVLVADGVEAVRARGHNLLDPGLVQRADVLLGQLLERVLVAHTTRGIARARLTRPEYAEVDARLLAQLRGPDRALLRALLE